MLYKIPFQANILLYVIVIFYYPGTIAAQDLTISAYGTPVQDKTTGYLRSVAKDSAKIMVELQSLIPGLAYDLRYATANNFMHRPMYPQNTSCTFLRMAPAKALAQVQRELNEYGLGLKIFDAYRPYSVTVHFWELVKDERYVANPAKGSGHNRGLAVDLTIIDLDTGEAFDMGTGFDNFTDSAHHSFINYPGSVLMARSLLKVVMTKAGFIPLETEWWHYYWPNNRDYEVLDIPFAELKKNMEE